MGLRDHLPCVVRSELLVNGQQQVLECRLLSRLGEGGMATVYLAELDGRRVAVKYLSTELLQSQASALDRFVREASLLKGLRHPNIVRVYNLGVDQEDCPFLVMELVEDAKTLATLIDVWRFRRAQAGLSGTDAGRYRTSLLPLNILLPLLRQVVEALAELHAQGIVHRDIKPDNVLVTEIGGRLVAKLTDLGISKSLVSKDPQLTAENCVVGTPFYMAPEAVRGCIINLASGKAYYVDKCSDVWGIGVVLYELITGRKPYDAELEDLPLTNRQRSSQEQANLLAANVVGKVADTNFRHAPLAKYVEEPNRNLAELVEICLVKEPWLRAPDASTLLTLIELAEREEEGRDRVSEDCGTALPPASIKLATGTRSEDVGELKTIASSPPPRQASGVREKAEDEAPEVRIVPAVTRAQPVFPRGLVAGFFLVALAIAGLIGYLNWRSDWVAPLVALTDSGPSVTVVPTSAPAPLPSPSTVLAKRRSDPGPLPGTQAHRILKQGQAAFQAGDCRTATKNMRAILAAHPAFPDAFRILGECARRSGDLAAARDNFERYLDFEGVTPLPPESMKVMHP